MFALHVAQDVAWVDSSFCLWPLLDVWMVSRFLLLEYCSNCSWARLHPGTSVQELPDLCHIALRSGLYPFCPGDRDTLCPFLNTPYCQCVLSDSLIGVEVLICISLLVRLRIFVILKDLFVFPPWWFNFFAPSLFPRGYVRVVVWSLGCVLCRYLSGCLARCFSNDVMWYTVYILMSFTNLFQRFSPPKFKNFALHI